MLDEDHLLPLNFEGRLRDLETKAIVRKIWADTARKVLPGLIFMAGSILMLVAAHDWLNRVAAVLFCAGSFMLTML